MAAPLKPLYQPWNEEIFSGDKFVQKMTNIQRWMYRTLLQNMFFCSTRPYLPKDPYTLSILSDASDEKQWEANSGVILRMFFTEIVDGEERWAHKRILEDWNRLVEKRELLSALGKKGGEATARRAYAEPYATAREVKRSEVKESEVKQKTGNLSTVLKQLPRICLEQLGVGTEKIEWVKEGLKDLVEATDGITVLTAFEGWCKDNPNPGKRPVAEFLRVARTYMSETRLKADVPNLDDFCGTLYRLSGKAFTGDHRLGLGRLLTEYSEKEVLRAYKEYIQGMSDFDLSRSSQTFVEGGAKTVIIAQQQFSEELKQHEATVEKNIEILQKQDVPAEEEPNDPMFDVVE